VGEIQYKAAESKVREQIVDVVINCLYQDADISSELDSRFSMEDLGDLEIVFKHPKLEKFFKNTINKKEAFLENLKGFKELCEARSAACAALATYDADPQPFSESFAKLTAIVNSRYESKSERAKAVESSFGSLRIALELGCSKEQQPQNPAISITIKEAKNLIALLLEKNFLQFCEDNGIKYNKLLHQFLSIFIIKHQVDKILAALTQSLTEMKFEGQLDKLEEVLTQYHNNLMNAQLYDAGDQLTYYQSAIDLLQPMLKLEADPTDALSHDPSNEKGIKIRPLTNAFLVYKVLQNAALPYSKEACEFLSGSLAASDSGAVTIKEVVISKEDANRLLDRLKDQSMTCLFESFHLKHVSSALVSKLQAQCGKKGWFW
jgi:hypothetical protein